MSGHPDYSGGAIDLAQAGPAGQAAVACLLIHVPGDQVGTPVRLWPDARVENHHGEVFGVDVTRDLGYRVRALPPNRVETTVWRRRSQLSCVLATTRDTPS